MCDLEDVGVSSIFKLILSTEALERMFPTLDLSCEENCCLLSNDKVRRTSLLHLFDYYETIKREVNTRLLYMSVGVMKLHERLKVKVEGSTRLTYTGLRGDWNT